MLVGKDVSVRDISYILGRTLVGDFCGKLVKECSQKKWLENFLSHPPPTSTQVTS